MDGIDHSMVDLEEARGEKERRLAIARFWNRLSVSSKSRARLRIMYYWEIRNFEFLHLSFGKDVFCN